MPASLPTLGFAALDLSTGEFRATEFTGPDADRRVADELQTLRPRELLYAASLPLFQSASPQPSFAARARAYVSAAAPRMASTELAPFARWSETPLDDWIFATDYAIPLVENHFGVLIAGRLRPRQPQRRRLRRRSHPPLRPPDPARIGLGHVDRISYYERQNCLILDAVTVRNLELIEPLFAGSGDAVTLFRALDHTLTPMGKRLLRAWMLRPSIDIAEINQRLDAVSAALASIIHREELRRSLDGILDIERLLSRITLETANPRDILALAASLAKLPAVRGALAHFPAARFMLSTTCSTNSPMFANASSAASSPSRPSPSTTAESSRADSIRNSTNSATSAATASTTSLRSSSASASAPASTRSRSSSTTSSASTSRSASPTCNTPPPTTSASRPSSAPSASPPRS